MQQAEPQRGRVATLFHYAVNTENLAKEFRRQRCFRCAISCNGAVLQDDDAGTTYGQLMLASIWLLGNQRRNGFVSEQKRRLTGERPRQVYARQFAAG